VPESRCTGAELRRRQIAAGYTWRRSSRSWCPDGRGRQGNGRLDGRRHAAGGAVKMYRPLSHYFRQNFSQVTNPPIDSLREYRVMSLKTRFGNLKNVLDEDSSQTEILVLESPFIANAEFA
jgi:glutamate synthase (NADPH) large chain